MDIYSILMRLIFLTYTLIDDISVDKKKIINTMTGHLPHTLSCTALIYTVWREKCYMGMSCVSDAVTCVSLTRDGQCLVVSSADNMVWLLDKESVNLLGEWVIWIKQEIFRLWSKRSQSEQSVMKLQ
jgi:WD40 repeat protein